MDAFYKGSSVKNLRPGFYFVYAVDKNTFCKSDLNFMEVLDETTLTGMTNNSSEMELFPNPADESYIFLNNLPSSAIIYITDLSGKNVKSFINNNRGATDVKLDISELLEGLYFIQIVSPEINLQKTFKLIRK